MPLTGRYFRSSEVDEPAVPVERGPLIFPENAYVWKLAGSVRARVFINEEGGVDSVQIVEARPAARHLRGGGARGAAPGALPARRDWRPPGKEPEAHRSEVRSL
jgi:hypothetical protein